MKDDVAAMTATELLATLAAPDPETVIEGVVRALAYLSTVDAAQGDQIRKATGFGRWNPNWPETWRCLVVAGLVEVIPAQTVHEVNSPKVRWRLTERGETVLWLLLAGARP